MELEEIKQRAKSIRSEQSSNKRCRWPREFKNAVAAYCEHGSTQSVSEATGIPRQMIRSWLKDKTSKSHSDGALFKKILVSGEDVKPKIIIEWPGAMKIDGLSYAEVRELLMEGLI